MSHSTRYTAEFRAAAVGRRALLRMDQPQLAARLVKHGWPSRLSPALISQIERGTPRHTVSDERLEGWATALGTTVDALLRAGAILSGGPASKPRRSA